MASTTYVCVTTEVKVRIVLALGDMIVVVVSLTLLRMMMWETEVLRYVCSFAIVVHRIGVFLPRQWATVGPAGMC